MKSLICLVWIVSAIIRKSTLRFAHRSAAYGVDIRLMADGDTTKADQGLLPAPSAAGELRREQREVLLFFSRLLVEREFSGFIQVYFRGDEPGITCTEDVFRVYTSTIGT